MKKAILSSVMLVGLVLFVGSPAIAADWCTSNQAGTQNCWIYGGTELRNGNTSASWSYFNPCKKDPNGHSFLEIWFVYTDSGRAFYGEASNVKGTVYLIEFNLTGGNGYGVRRYVRATKYGFNNEQLSYTPYPYGADQWDINNAGTVVGDSWVPLARNCY